MPNSSFKKNSGDNYEPINGVGGDKLVRTLPMNINPKLNVIVRLEFEPANYDVAF